jgi:hypothetical protein
MIALNESSENGLKKDLRKSMANKVYCKNCDNQKDSKCYNGFHNSFSVDINARRECKFFKKVGVENG